MQRSRYLLAAIAPLVVAALVVVYSQATGGGVLFGAFSVAVFVAAIAGGLGPGLLATAISVALAYALYQDWVSVMPAPTETDAARLLVMGVAGVIASLLGGQVRSERRQSEVTRLTETRAHRASEEALGRLATLQSLTQDLSRSLTTVEIAEAVVRHGRRAMGAAGGVVFLLDKDGQDIAVAAADGFPPDLVERFRRFSIEAPLPAAAVIREGRPMFLADADAYRTRFPETARITGRPASTALAMAPLTETGQVVGAIGWTFAEPQVFDEDRRRFIVTIGGLCSQAMERSRAYEAERSSRERGDQLARLEAERSAELRSIISAIGDGLMVVDSEGRVRSMNGAAQRALGGPVNDADELRRRLRVEDEFPPAGIAFGPVEYQLAARPGSWIELTAYVVEHGQDAGPGSPASVDVAAARDREDGAGATPAAAAATTAPAGPEDARVSDAAGPDRARTDSDVRPSTVWLVRDVTAFRQGQRLREAFLSLLSHELRTPVTTIYAAANVLGRSDIKLAPEVRQDVLEDIVGESNRLYRLVEDLLVLARFDEGLSLGRDPNLVQHLVRGVVEGERLRWPAVRFEVVVDGPVPTVSGDETSIQQVLRNLLSNAAKYSAAGSTVLVQVSAEAGGTAVRVLDEGMGIRVDELDQLFDPFYRSPATAKMAGGAGIGLYVCRRLIEAMGGRVWARRREAVGSEFGFWLPAYEEAADHERDEPFDDETDAMATRPGTSLPSEVT